MDVERERGRFEAWVFEEAGDRILAREGDRYFYGWTRSAWDGWLARARLADEDGFRTAAQLKERFFPVTGRGGAMHKASVQEWRASVRQWLDAMWPDAQRNEGEG